MKSPRQKEAAPGKDIPLLDVSAERRSTFQRRDSRQLRREPRHEI